MQASKRAGPDFTVGFDDSGYADITNFPEINHSGIHFRIKQPVHMDNEISHMHIIDG